METNSQKLERLGMMDNRTIDKLTEEIRCNYCPLGSNYGVISYSGPNGATFCEGRFCYEAIEEWLEDEADESDDEYFLLINKSN